MAQVKLQSGITVEVVPTDDGSVIVRTPFMEEEISPDEAREVAAALKEVADEA